MSAPDPIVSPLAIRCFGPFDVRIDGLPIAPLRTQKGQWLLALLTLRGGREVKREWLAGTLWPRSQEEQALYNLRRTLSDLRQALGAQSDRLRSPAAHTLSLDLSGVQVDVLAFDDAAARDDARSLESAVALYSGELLEGCAEEWVWLERTTREQSYLNALERLAEQAMREGDAGRAAGYLQRVIAREPLREGTQRLLLQALAAGGDFAAAIQVYRELRSYLRRELNAEPDAETSALFERLRLEARARTQLQPPRPAESGGAPAPSSAWEPVDHESPKTPPHNLPAQMSSFIGREEDVETLRRLLRSSRLLTLTGVGGAGKTRLATEVAAQILEEYVDGVWLVELASLSDPELMPQAVARALGLREEPGRGIYETLVEYLKNRQLLLVLDNCEHLVQACAELADRLLRLCPRLRLLATSRQLLRVPGEAAWRVPSLLAPNPESLPVDGGKRMEVLSEFAAVRLFVARSEAADSSFRLTPQNAEATALVCHRLDGIPLAIELAAARVNVLSVEQIAARLDDRFRLLTSGSRTTLPRQQTLRALTDWSHDLLSEPERTLLRRMSVFAGGWTEEAATAVGAGEEVGAEDVFDLLSGLVEKSLVQAEDQEGRKRYRLQETLRLYALERLAASGEEPAVCQRHQFYFVRWAEEVEELLQGPEQAAWLERVEADHGNLRAALRTCDTSPDGAEAGLRLGAALWWFWMVRGYVSEGRAHLARALARQGARATAGPIAAARAKALNGAGNLAYTQGDYAAAQDLHEVSLVINHGLGNLRGAARSLNNLGLISLEQGDYAVARTLYQQSLALWREQGSPVGAAYSLGNLGLVALEQGDYVEARSWYEQSLALYRELSSAQGVANCLGNLGLVAIKQNKLAEAREVLEESLALRRTLQEKRGVASAHLGLGLVAAREGDAAGAWAFYAESLATARELGDKKATIVALEAIAALKAEQGDAGLAARLFGAAEAGRAEASMPMPVSDRLDYERSVAVARDAIGPDAFAEDWAAGRALALENAVTLAL